MEYENIFYMFLNGNKYQRAFRYDVAEKMVRLLMFKIWEPRSCCENFSMDGDIHVDEFVLGSIWITSLALVPFTIATMASFLSCAFLLVKIV